jgi:hypothetical protein
MSEANETAAAADTLPGLVVTTRMVAGNPPAEILVATWGEARKTMELKPLTLGDQFDLAEVTGPNAANAVWVNMATVAASVYSFDGIPLPCGFSRDNLKTKLNRIGMDGLRAGMLALNGYRGAGEVVADPDDAKVAVGN